MPYNGSVRLISDSSLVYSLNTCSFELLLSVTNFTRYIYTFSTAKSTTFTRDFFEIDYASSRHNGDSLVQVASGEIVHCRLLEMAGTYPRANHLLAADR